jgi:hypothetical protein
MSYSGENSGGGSLCPHSGGWVSGFFRGGTGGHLVVPLVMWSNRSLHFETGRGRTYYHGTQWCIALLGSTDSIVLSCFCLNQSENNPSFYLFTWNHLPARHKMPLSVEVPLHWSCALCHLNKKLFRFPLRKACFQRPPLIFGPRPQTTVCKITNPHYKRSSGAGPPRKIKVS